MIENRILKKKCHFLFHTSSHMQDCLRFYLSCGKFYFPPFAVESLEAAVFDSTSFCYAKLSGCYRRFNTYFWFQILEWDIFSTAEEQGTF